MTSERLYSALLHLYPTRFRMDYGDAMLDAFRAARRDTPLIPFWFLMASDLCRSVCQEHVREASPGLIHVARCTLAAVLAMTSLVGGGAVGFAAWGNPARVSDELHIVDLRTGW